MSSPTPREPFARSGLAAVAIAAAATSLACLPFAPGYVGLAGLLLAFAVAAATGAGLLALFPQALAAIVPALIPSPMFLLTFAWELALLLAGVLLLLHGWRTRAAWLARLGSIEIAVVAFTAWALFSGLWSEDLRWYAIGARRLLMGWVALWVATRLPHIAERRWFDLGLLAGASALAITALVRSQTRGFSAEQLISHRTEVTNLGWGTANYIAGLLLLFAPSLLRLALRETRSIRVAAWVALGLVASVEFIVASRAALVLFAIGILAQLLRFVRVARAWVALVWLGVVSVMIFSPLGSVFVSRLESVRELGSFTIRLWYFREAWTRLLANLPWGLGLWQGYGHADRLQGIDPHNWWLLIGGDLGLPGLLLWASVLWMIVRRIQAERVNEAGREHAWMLGLTVVLANLHTLVEPTFQGAHYQLLFYWIVCGALAYGAPALAPARLRIRTTARRRTAIAASGA